MHVTCEQCKTTYRLDDSLVKEAGTKVRCSKCKYIFLVYPEADAQQISQVEPERRGSGARHGGVIYHDQFTDDDFKYLQKKTRRITKQRNHYDVSIEEDCFTDSGLPAIEERKASPIDNDDNEQIETGEDGNWLEDADRFESADTRTSELIKSVPILDGDFEISSNDKSHYRQGPQPDDTWEVYDYEPDEFDETIRRPEPGIVDTDKEVPKEDRALQIAMEVGELYAWGHEQVKSLAKVFSEYGWSLTKTAILRELELGMTFDEFQLAVDIRRIWYSHTEFSIGCCLRGSYGDNSLKYRSVYKNPDWSFCMKIIRKFDSIPDAEEIEHHFTSLYTMWKDNPGLQDRYVTYYGFINSIVDAGEIPLYLPAWQYFH